MVYGIYYMVSDIEYMAYGIGYKVDINMRILPNVISGIPLLLGLGPRM